VRHDVDLPKPQRIQYLSQEDHRKPKQVAVTVVEGIGQAVTRQVHGDHVPLSGKLLQDRCPCKGRTQRTVDQEQWRAASQLKRLNLPTRPANSPRAGLRRIPLQKSRLRSLDPAIQLKIHTD
jgi:hypothetical protein